MNLDIVLQLQFFASIGVTISTSARLFNQTEVPFTASSYAAVLSFLAVQVLAAMVTYKRSMASHTQRSKLALVVSMSLVVANTILVYGLIYRNFGLMKSGSITKDPVDCLYFSIVTWTTLGYGDITPSDQLRMLAASESLLGYIVMAVLIATFIKLLDERGV